MIQKTKFCPVGLHNVINDIVGNQEEEVKI